MLCIKNSIYRGFVYRGSVYRGPLYRGFVQHFTLKTLYIIIIYYLMSDLDPYWAYIDYSLFIYREKT